MAVIGKVLMSNKPTLSVVMPVFNAKDFVKRTLVSLVKNSEYLKEVIVVDDHSEDKTRSFIDSLQIDDELNIRLIKTRNPKHTWTNGSWNIGVKLASSEYVAVVNSDITFSKDWDRALIKELEKSTIACPVEKRGDYYIELDPLIKQVHPGMICGACYMFKTTDRSFLFPIPKILIHYCGDNVLADRANEANGVNFSSDAIITHAITRSGATIDRKLYFEVTYNDVLNYQTMSKRDMKPILDEIWAHRPED